MNIGEHKDNTFEVLSLSISNHYNIIVENAKVILAYIDSENIAKLALICKTSNCSIDPNRNIKDPKNSDISLHIEIYIAIEPVPQNKSYTTSSPVKLDSSNIIS